MNSVRDLGVTIACLVALSACNANVSSNVPASPVQTEADAPPAAPQPRAAVPTENRHDASSPTTDPANVDAAGDDDDDDGDPVTVAPVQTTWERTASTLRFKSYREFCERQRRCVAVYDDEDVEDPQAALERLRCWSDLDVCEKNGKPKAAKADTAASSKASGKLRDGDHAISVIQLGSDLAGTTRWRCVLKVDGGHGLWLVPVEPVCGGLIGPESAADHRVLDLAWLPDRKGQAFWLRLQILQKRWSPKGSPTPDEAQFAPEYELVTVCALGTDGPRCSAIVPVAYRSFDTDQMVRNELGLTADGLEVKAAAGVTDWDLENLFVGTLTPDTAVAPTSD